jgi:zinc/manganese transport system substrate-binding protein
MLGSFTQRVNPHNVRSSSDLTSNVERRTSNAALRIITTLLLVCCVCAEDRLRVVTTTTILADMVRQIGGDRVQVSSLLKPGIDAHIYQPGPEDLKSLAGAAVVVVNGLGLEGWLGNLVSTSGFQGRQVIATTGITPLGCDHHEGHEAHGGVDPHAWQDAANGLHYARNICAGLSAADPLGAADYAAWTEAYCGQLRVLDAWIRKQITTIPPDRRVLVTSHEALAYFGRAYGLEMHAMEGTATGQEPNARHLAELIALIRTRRIGAVFIENTANPATVERLGRDAGTTSGGRLVCDGLDGPGGPADTYIGMFLVNTRTIVRGLSR